MHPRIQFANVSKIYRLGGSSGSLRTAMIGLFHSQLKKSQQDLLNLAALNRVSFEIGSGESVGIIGPNGSGKTTALKLISNITRCNLGNVKINGRVSALIELGAGFHPDLTGRENIYFNAAILGMNENEIQQRFDAIVDFSGLERFLDTPVKRYSSGMYCRLGFAVAAFVNPEILLIDEVLSVGDSAFQNKCLKRMNELREEGTTIVFVTHNLGYLQRLCLRALFLYKGKVVIDGPLNQVIQTYRDHVSYYSGGNGSLDEITDPLKDKIESDFSISPPCVRILEVYFVNGFQQRIDRTQTGGTIEIHIVYEVIQPVNHVNFEVWFYGMDGSEYASFATEWDGFSPINLDKNGEVLLLIDELCLMPGAYFVNVAISDHNGLVKYDTRWEHYRLLVISGPISHGMIYQPHKWLLHES